MVESQKFNKLSLKNLKLSDDFAKVNLLLKDYNFDKTNSFSEKTIKKIKKGLQTPFIKFLDHSIGLKTFNKNFYIPVNKYILKNKDSLIKTIKEESFYDIDENPDFLDTRIFIQASYEYMGICHNKEEPQALLKDLKESAPRKGSPCIFVVNHPFGIIDTLLTAKVMSTLRPDIKFLANSMVSTFCPEIKSLLLDVNVLGGSNDKSVSSVDLAIEHLNSGGMLIMFPDPVIPFHKPWGSIKKRTFQKLDFKKGIGQLLLSATKASVLMGAISGEHQNSRYFQTLSSIHPTLKMTSLLGEFVKTKNNLGYSFKVSPVVTSEEIQALVKSGKESQTSVLSSMTDLDKSKHMAALLAKYLEKIYKINFNFLVKK